MENLIKYPLQVSEFYLNYYQIFACTGINSLVDIYRWIFPTGNYFYFVCHFKVVGSTLEGKFITSYMYNVTIEIKYTER